MEKNNASKDRFIAILAGMTPDDINEFIKEKGKEPKLVKPFIKVIEDEGVEYEY